MKVIIHSLAFSLLLLISSKSLAESVATDTAPADVAAYTKSADSKVIEVLGNDQFEKVVVQSQKPVVIKFGAPWCPACSRAKAPFEKIASDPEFADVTFVEMDFDKNSSIAQKYDVQSLPTFLYFKNGKPAATKTGFSENLKNEVRATLTSLGDGEKKSAEAATTPAQEEVSGPGCAAPTEGGILQSISNFFTSLWNTVTGWFK